MATITAEDATQIVRVFCAEATTLGLCTVNEQREPHAANVNFVADSDMNLYFVSNPQSAHAAHLLSQPTVACSIYTPFRKPAEIRGVQLRGTCKAIESQEFDFVWKMFRQRFEYAERFEQRGAKRTVLSNLSAVDSIHR